MLSLKLECDVPEDRNVHLHIRLPDDVKPGRHEIVLVVDNAMESAEFSPSEQFADLAGSLSWPEEPLEYQRRLREEWP